MKTKVIILITLIFITINLSGQSKKVLKVACIGNSITYGSKIENRIKNSYPAQLDLMLGSNYEIRNYGYSGRTLLSKGDYPYMVEDKFFDAIEWNPDIVIIMLGTNDSKPQNWKYKKDFITDYNKMLTAFDTLTSTPKIYITSTVPVYKTMWGINDSTVKNEINPLIKKIANENELHFIDLYTPLLGEGKLFPDYIHPNSKGAGEMAKIIYQHLTGKQGDIVDRKYLGKKTIWKGFEIETPRLGADFIKYYTKLPKQKLNSSNYHIIRGGLQNSFIKFEQEKKARVAFLGGSITYNGGWRDSLMQYIQNRFPQTKFEFIASGIPSFGSTEDVFRLKRDILKKGQVDLLFVEAAVNDGGKGRSNEEQMRSMEGIVRHARNVDPTTDIVFMYFVDPKKMEIYRKGEIPQVIINHDSVAEYYNIPAINLTKEVTERIDAGEFTWKDDFQNLHPSPFGQGVYAHSMITFLENTWNGFVADDDKIIDYTMPEKLDVACYENGVLVPAVEIRTTKGWKVDDNWDPKDKMRKRDNYINVPMLIGKYPGEILNINFTGNAVGIAVAAGPDAGIIEYRIDEGEWKRKDIFTKHSTSYHLPWYYTLADDLKSDEHVLQLRLTDDKNPKSVGNVCRIRYFYFNKSE